MELELLHEPAECKSSKQPENVSKNRYHNILANEDTRVKLETQIEENTDYINANFINGEVQNSERAYIAGQAPLLSTLNDF